MEGTSYYRIPAQEVMALSKIPIFCMEDQPSVFYKMALEMAETIEEHNREGKRTVYILPFGPTGQYPFFVDLVNKKRIDLKHTWFISMDDWLGKDGRLVKSNSIHSLRRKFEAELYSKIVPELLMPQKQRLFPDPERLGDIPEQIRQLGGVDICFAGIGINGHLGFNEPMEAGVQEFAGLGPRIVKISDLTIAVKASSGFHGALEDIPAFGVTIGMKEMLEARKVSVYCFRDWHSGAVRRAGCGPVTARFPASLLQLHSHASITCSPNALAPCY